jgi:hypothetical protein
MALLSMSTAKSNQIKFLELSCCHVIIRHVGGIPGTHIDYVESVHDLLLKGWSFVARERCGMRCNMHHARPTAYITLRIRGTHCISAYAQHRDSECECGRHDEDASTFH